MRACDIHASTHLIVNALIYDGEIYSRTIVVFITGTAYKYKFGQDKYLASPLKVSILFG